MSAIYPALGLGLGAWIMANWGMRLGEWLSTMVLPQFESDIRTATVHHLSQHSHSYFAGHMAGNLASKADDLSRALESLLHSIRWSVIGTLGVVITSLLIMAKIQPYFALLLGGWVLLDLLLYLYFARHIGEAGRQYAEVRSQLSGRILDGITNSVAVKLFAKRNHERAYIAAAQRKEQTYNEAVRWQILRYRFVIDLPLMLMWITMGYLLITSWQVGRIGTGDLIFVFNSTWAIVFRLWFLGNSLKLIFKEYSLAQQALDTLFQPHEISDKSRAPALKVTEGAVHFHEVDFYYTEELTIFQKKQVKIQPHEKLGLVGFSGSGKSTFVNLILLFFDIQGGQITIEGQDIAGVTQYSLRKNIAMIPQDTTLFHRSVMENIRYSKLSATDKEVMEAARQAACHAFIMKLPQGYATMVCERGTKLSGGQRQRIAIARAILKDAPILILDEATSALDSLTERQVQQRLYSLMKGRTTIVIAHRISTLVEMDRILLFEDGKVVEEGSHQELLAKQGGYARMWEAQSAGFLPETSI